MLRCFLFGLIVLSLSLSGSTSAADGKDGRKVWTEPPHDNPDFAMQGEYLGSAINDWCQWESVGLQVVARGTGQFDAVEYRGGLPGYGWPIGGDRTKYKGTREGDVLTLTSEDAPGEDRQITIRHGHAVISTTGDCVRRIGSACAVKRQSSTLGLCPPCNAVVLFNDTDTKMFKNAEMTDDGLLKEGTQTREAYGDMRLHLEFRLPYMPHASGQGRANSGVYVQSRYEVQILDSFGREGKFNECGALYKERKPDLNMCLPPLTWQTYDIWFTAARFDSDGNKVRDARFTVWLNGVPIHQNVVLPTPTGAGKRVGESPKPLPTKLQNHGNPVRFRNIWLIPSGPGSHDYAPKQLASAADADPRLAGLLDAIGVPRN